MTKKQRRAHVKQSEQYLIKQLLPLFNIETETKPSGSLPNRFLGDQNDVMNEAIGFDPNLYTSIMNEARRNIKKTLKEHYGL